MDEKEAVIRARAFCEAIGESITLGAVVTYSTATSEVMRPTRYYGLVWVVKFSSGKSDEVTVTISDDKGFVCGYNCEPLAPWLTGKEDVGAMLTRRIVLEKAEVYRHHAGLTEELICSDMSLATNNDGDKKGDCIWYVSYDRVAYGTPYQGQHLRMGIDPVTGRLQGFSLNFTSSAATSFNQYLSKSQAFALAANYLSVYKNCRIHPDSAKLMYAARDKHPMLAWEIYFKFDKRLMTLLIDDKTGRVVRDEEIYGCTATLLIHCHHALLRLRQIAENAVQICKHEE